MSEGHSVEEGWRLAGAEWDLTRVWCLSSDTANSRVTVSVAQKQMPGSAPIAFGPRLGDLGQVT